jgi:hypothetical protein
MRVNARQKNVVSQFDAILKGCELLAVGERCDTHGTRSDLILTLKGSPFAPEVCPLFRVKENVYHITNFTNTFS